MDYEEEEAAEPGGDGCLPIFLLPPLAVLIIGLFLGFLLLGPIGVSASAEDHILQTNFSASDQGSGEENITQIQEAPLQELKLESQPETAMVMVPTSIPEVEPSTNDEPVTYSQPTTFSAEISPIFTPEIHYWGDEIAKWATRAGVDPNLAATVMQIESCGDPKVVSRAGAMGLFQVMPFHFLEDEDPYIPDVNARRGLDYLKLSYDTAGGDIRLTLAGYNGGIGVISRSESTWAAETIRYIFWGTGIYADAVDGRTESLRLQEWLYTSGASMCRQAAERIGISQ